MTNITINSLPTASTIDGSLDILPIYTASSAATQGISRNTLLNIASNPVGISDSQTLTNKTITAPTISSPILSGTITGIYTIGGTPTFPSSVVTLAGSQTLTNKVLTSPTINSPTITNATITADAITGFSSANTGTIYGLSVSSGTIGTAGIANNAITTALINNAAVTASKLGTGATAASVATAEATSSTSYTDLATTTDSVTVTIGANGLALVIIAGHIANNTTANIGYISFAASGANTIAAADARAFYEGSLTGLSQGQGSWAYLATGLSTGSTTFKMKYRTSANSCTFDSRNITVIPL